MDNLNIQNFEITNLTNPSFVKPVRLNYSLNQANQTWEAVKSHDSVAVLLYHTSKDAFLLVKQFRAPVFMNHENYKFTYELCAGIVDKDISLLEISKEEIEEECGYKVHCNDIEKISSFFTNVGVSGAKQHLFFTTIDETMKIGEGGGIHNEYIEKEFVSVKDSKAFIYDESKAKTPGLMFAFYWFYEKFHR